MIGSPATPSRILPSTTPQIFDPSIPSRHSDRNVRKRKRSTSESVEHLPGREYVIGQEHLPDGGPIRSKKKKSEVRMTAIRPPNFVCPKTAYSGHIPSMPRYSEKSVLQDILVG